MQVKPEVKRSLRVEREEEMHIDDESAHLWAISYSDFLMVLLSFFVIFFSVSPGERGTIIDAIIASTRSRVDSREWPVKEVGGSGPNKARLPTSLLAVANEIQSLDKMENELKGEISFLFPDDVYPKNSVVLLPRHQRTFDELMRRLLPYKDSVEIVFIGHTDNVPVTPKIREEIKNNFDLSSLRASRAIVRAIDLGWAPTSLYSKGAGEFARSSRTLTVVVQIREERMPSTEDEER